MRIIRPHCFSKALIYSSNQLSETVKNLYCSRTNSRGCGTMFVFMLAYKHNLNPPRNNTVQIAALISRLPYDEQKGLQRDLFG